MMTGRHASATASITQASKLITDSATAKPDVDSKPEIPRQPRILKVLLPTTLPTAKSR
jgi:hypothetical protein